MADSRADGYVPYVFVVQMDIPAEHEAEFNRVYDEEHVPDILTVPGVRSCRRYKLESSTREGVPRYMAIYEVDSPDIVNSPAWLAMSERGSWAPTIRPLTTNRWHQRMRRIR